MASFFEDEGGTAVLDSPGAKNKRSVRTKPFAPFIDSISGNKYDIVLGVQPNIRDNYSFYDRIVRFVEDRGSKIYSPHDDFRRKRDLEDAVNFTVREAIPRTKAVLVHLTIITPEIKRIFESAYKNSKPFLLFYHEETNPFSRASAHQIMTHPFYRGEIKYDSEQDLIDKLGDSLDDLIKEH